MQYNFQSLYNSELALEAFVHPDKLSLQINISFNFEN